MQMSDALGGEGQLWSRSATPGGVSSPLLGVGSTIGAGGLSGVDPVPIVDPGASQAVSRVSWLGQVELPWPPRACNPNATRTTLGSKKPLWVVLFQAKRQLRAAARRAVLDLGGPAVTRTVNAGPLALQLRFDAPNLFRRDLDNAIASMKAAIDGLADGLGIDDSQFVRWSASRGPCYRPHGRVLARWGPMECLGEPWGEDLSLVKRRLEPVPPELPSAGDFGAYMDRLRAKVIPPRRPLLD